MAEVEQEVPEKDQEAQPRPTAKAKGSTTDNLIEKAYWGTAEKTIQYSSYDDKSQLRPYNPDDLYQKTGNYDIYEDMLNDDQISVCLQLKKDLVIGSGWDIQSDDEGQDDMVEDITIALNEDPERPFDDCLEEILTAFDFGFSLTEKVFKTRADGSLALKFLKTRNPNTWLIHTDDQGNITKFEQRGVSKDLEINPEALIHYTVGQRFGNPYGRSDARAAYLAWFAKRQILRFYAIYLEKAASATPVARYDKNAPPEAVDDIYNAIKKLQAKTALTIPKDIELEFLETKNSGEAYEKAINIFNMFIGRAMFIPDLLGLHGAQTSGGAYSLGKEQIGIFLKHINRRRKALEDKINNEIIWPIVLYNFGFVDNYPKFKLRPISDDVAIEGAKLWLDAMKGKLYKPTEEEVNFFRNIIKFPEGEVEFNEPPPQLQLGPDGKPLPPNPNDPNQAPPQPGEDDQPEGEDEKPAPEQDDTKKKVLKLGKLPPGSFHKKVDFKMMKKQLDAFDAATMRDVRPVVSKIFENLFEQLRKKKVVQSGDISRIEDLKLRGLGALKQVLKKNFKELYREGWMQARSEIYKSNFATKPTTALTTDQLEELLDNELFQYIGDWEYAVTRGARTEIIAAIKDGKPISSVIDAISEDGIKSSLQSLERYSRTKHTEVFNRARLAFFEESGVVTGYQYSAILDDVTSEICRELDGKVFEAGDQPVPPMHFNCRSVLIPITKYEDFTPDKEAGGEDIDDFIENNKGKGFPKQ